VLAYVLASELKLSGDLAEVQADFEAQMAVTTALASFTYQFSAFGLELPEIGILNMLLRTPEQFNRFKEYLLLFLARILARE